MARVIIEAYPHRPGGHCSSTALRDLMEFYGFHFTEEMVFGLGVGVGFIYYSHPGMKPPVYIGGRIYNLEEQFSRHLGIGLEIVSGLGPEEGWQDAKEMIDSGTPVIAHADVHYLDYLRAKVHFSGHRIVLVGYDEEKGVAFVADNDRDEVQECSLENLMRARSAAYLPQPADNTYYKFDIPEKLIPLAEAIPPALQKAVKYNLRLTPDSVSFIYDGARVVRGVTGLEEFADGMAGWPAQMDADALSLLCKSIYVTAEKGGTGYGGNFRRIYGRFLKEASLVMEYHNLDRIGDEFIAIGDIWTNLSMTFKELSGDGASAVVKAQPLASEIYERETAVYAELESVALCLMKGL